MTLINRVILIVLDSVGVGELPDAFQYGDKGSDTIGNISKKLGGLKLDNLTSLGLGNIEGIKGLTRVLNPIGSFGKCMEASKGKDTITGHWEIAGVIIREALKTFPMGYPDDFIKAFEEKIGRGVIGNIVASGTEIIENFGQEHIETGKPIVYTSADSVFQIAAHEEVIPIDELYRICKIARGMLMGENQVGRVIARPFIGEEGKFERTSNRRDYALDPFDKTILEYIKENKKDVIAVGKIEDIYNGIGITKAVHIKNNEDGINKTIEFMKEENSGLIFTNLVDFDMLYGHRNDYKGYGSALEYFDLRLKDIIGELRDDDVLILTADHGCDPTTISTDHSREYIPVVVYGKNIKGNVNLGIRTSFCDIGKSVLELLGIENNLNGEGFYKNLVK